MPVHHLHQTNNDLSQCWIAVEKWNNTSLLMGYYTQVTACLATKADGAHGRIVLPLEVRKIWYNNRSMSLYKRPDGGPCIYETKGSNNSLQLEIILNCWYIWYMHIHILRVCLDFVLLRAFGVYPKVRDSSPLQVDTFLSIKIRHFHKNIRWCVENECYCPHTAKIPNVDFIIYIFTYTYPKNLLRFCDPSGRSTEIQTPQYLMNIVM